MSDPLILPLAVDLDALRADLDAMEPDDWERHFNQGYYEGTWDGVPLRRTPGIKPGLYHDPGVEEFVATSAMERCREVPRILAQLECPLATVRFLRLHPGSRIREHRDPGLRIEESVARLHIPVVTHEDVEFISNGTPLRMQPGECWYVDFHRKHSVHNGSPVARVHLIIDVTVNPWLHDWFSRGRGAF